MRTSSSDIFSLAVRLHLLLLRGAHPFRGQWRGRGPAPAEHVLAGDGLWSYAGDSRLEPVPDAPPLDVLPQTLQQYFRAAFVDGARRPQDRPPAQQWVAALVRLRESLVTCAREPSHVHGSHLPGCPWCPPGPRPSRTAGSVPPGYTRPHLPARPPAAAAAAPGSAPTLPAAPDGTSTVRWAPTPPDGPRPAPAARPRHRSALRAVAWAVLAVVGIGVAIGVAGATGRSEPAATGPAGAASTRAYSAPPSGPEPPDPTGALERTRTGDAATVETLADSWVAQLSARPAGAGTATDAAVLAGHDAVRERFPGAVLLRSTDWNYAGNSWITVMSERFATADEANAWCDTRRIAPRECFAKKLSRSSAVEGSEKYRG